MPAVTFIPSESFAFANCLASFSVGNDFVCLTEGAREETDPCFFGVSTETNQRLMRIVCRAMLAEKPPRMNLPGYFISIIAPAPTSADPNAFPSATG